MLANTGQLIINAESLRQDSKFEKKNKKKLKAISLSQIHCSSVGEGIQLWVAKGSLYKTIKATITHSLLQWTWVVFVITGNSLYQGRLHSGSVPYIILTVTLATLKKKICYPLS